MGLPGFSWGFIWDLVGFICDCSVTFMQQVAKYFFFTFFLNLNFRPGQFQMSTAVAKSPKGVFFVQVSTRRLALKDFEVLDFWKASSIYWLRMADEHHKISTSRMRLFQEAFSHGGMCGCHKCRHVQRHVQPCSACACVWYISQHLALSNAILVGGLEHVYFSIYWE